MTETQDILFGVTGQSIYFDCPEGRPSSITSVSVYENDADDSGATESATTGSAAVETNPSTTFDQNSGVSSTNQNICYLAATTGIVVGRRYLATTATGETEWVEVKQISSGDSVLVRNPLINDYVSADTFQSTRISIGVDATWVAEQSNVSVGADPNPRYRVRWVYVVGGVTYVQASYVDLVRYRGTHQVSGLDVDRAFPGWLDSLPTYHREDQGASVIAEAYRQVKLDLYRHGKADQLLRNAEAVNNLVVFKAHALTAVSAVTVRGTPPELAEYARKLYGDELTNLIAWPKVAMDVTGQGAATNKPAAMPIFIR